MKRPTRREALKTMGAGAAALTSGCAFGPSGTKPRPNVLFVMTDDQQHDQMSCAGAPILQTPNMDRLAAEGVRFRNAFCTNSLCAPGRASVLTGTLSHVHGIRGNSEKADQVERLDPTLPTFPAVLQAEGYRTGLVGKWHLRQDPAGFDEWRVLPGQGVYQDPDFVENGNIDSKSGYATDITTDLALNFLQETATRTQPWCLVYQHKAPHRPFTPAERHRKLFADVDWPKPKTYNDDYATRRIAAEARDMQFSVSLAGDYPDLPDGLSPEDSKEWIFDRFVKDHNRSVYGVDENLGRVLDFLDESGQAEDTLVVYTTDNGFFLGEHGWYDKRFMYEPALRIPLLMRYPRGLDAGRVDDGFVMNIDLAPTILDIAGAPVPEQMQGLSVLPALESPERARRSTYYSYYENSWSMRDMSRAEMTDPSFAYWTAHRVGPNRGVRTERFKLIEYYTEDGYGELFDLAEDPHELRSLYFDSGYAEIREELTRELRQTQAAYGDLA